MTTTAREACSPSKATPEHRRRRLFRLLLVAIAVLGVLATVVRIESGPERARAAVQRRDFGAARDAIHLYLRFHPGDSAARLLAAEAWDLDNSLPPDEAARASIAHLQAIPDEAPQGPAARLREGRLTFLILHRPAAGEALLTRAAELQTDREDAYYLRWRLLDMTERYFESESLFWATYERTPAELRPHRLREWYLSQFAPFSACMELDALMGFREPSQPTDEEVAFLRLQSFFSQEPDAPMVVAALAQWHLRNLQRETALEILDGVSDPASALRHPSYVAALIETLFELGQFERVEQVFADWPPPLDGYTYWRLRGIIEQEIRSEPGAAAEAYARALSVWPGPSDWPTMRRRAHCLARLGDETAAAELRMQAERVERLMELDVHRRIKSALEHLDDPGKLLEVVSFYEALGRPREVREWRSIIDRLESGRDSDRDSP